MTTKTLVDLIGTEDAVQLAKELEEVFGGRYVVMTLGDLADMLKQEEQILKTKEIHSIMNGSNEIN